MSILWGLITMVIHIVVSVLKLFYKGLVFKRLNKNGQVNMALSLTMGAAVVASTSVYYTSRSDTNKQIRTEQIYDTIKLAASNLRGVINNESAWVATVNFSLNSDSLGCFTNPAVSCCGLSNQPFTVVSQTGTPVFELRTGYAATSAGQSAADVASIPYNGFSLQGDVCNTYNPADGNADCPFRIHTYWSSINPTPIDTQCKLPPKIKMVVDVKNSRGRTEHINHTHRRWSFLEFIRGAGEDSLAAHCVKMNGVWDPKTNTCTLRAAIAENPTLNQVDCASEMGTMNSYTNYICNVHKNCEMEAAEAGFPNQTWVFKGFDVHGQRVCGPPSSSGFSACPSGQAITQISAAAGSISGVCAPYPKMALPDLSGCPPWYNVADPPWPAECPSWHQDPANLNYCYCDYQVCHPSDTVPPNAVTYRREWNYSLNAYQCVATSCPAGHITPPPTHPDHKLGCYPVCSDYKGSGWNPGGSCKYASCNSPFVDYDATSATCSCPAGKVEDAGTCKTPCSNTTVNAFNNSGINTGPVLLNKLGFVEDGCAEACSNGWNYLSSGVLGEGCYQCLSLNTCVDGCGVTSYSCSPCPAPGPCP